MAIFTHHRRSRLLFLPAILLLICAGAGPLEAQGTFLRTGDLTVGRNLASATLLKDGRVLVTGGTRTGTTGTVYNKEAEIYDPNTGAFTATGSMTTPRVAHAALALTDGTLLVLGGRSDGTTSLNSAELFDPTKGAFTATGKMTFARESPTATLLKDGRVFVVGGTFQDDTGTNSLRDSDIYDPKAGTFTHGPLLASFRVFHAAVGLPDGRVLVIGGLGLDADTGAATVLKDVELFDPTATKFSTVGQLNEEHINPSATLLPDGRVVVAGGQVQTSDGRASTTTIEIFDPATGKSTTAGKMSEGRTNHVGVALTDGRVLLAGGGTGIGQDHSVVSADLFDPAAGKVTATAPLSESRTQAASVRLLDGSVLILGGARIVGGAVAARLQTAELFKP